MKLRELMKLLERCDAEAEVVLANQPHYPIERCCVARPETGLVADQLAVARWAEAASLQIDWQ